MSSLDNNDSSDLMPTLKSYLRIEQLFESPKDLEEVTKEFQTADVMLEVTQKVFDAVSEDSPSVESRFSSSANINMMPDFEAGIVKIQQDRCLEPSWVTRKWELKD